MTDKKVNDKLEDITGSGIEVTIKGKEYKLGIFSMRDLADFRQYVKGQRVQDYTSNYSKYGRKVDINK